MRLQSRIVRLILGIAVLATVIPPQAGAQTPPPPPSGAPPPPPPPPGSAPLPAPQLDQLLAPIALYPDPLLAQVLMAATYPLEIVLADRWLQDPYHAALRGEQLSAALEAQPWDPSVKSLVPFPRVLGMMNDNLTWTEQLGDAFLADQAAVTDSVQRLRQQARAAGRLQSTPQEIVSEQGQLVTIEPPNPEVVYVPVYDPGVVYGPWLYPDYPPYDFAGYFGDVTIGGFGFGWVGVGIIAPLWGWCRWDWHRRRIDVDDRFNDIDRHRHPVTPGPWHHDPGHRDGVPYRDPRTRAIFQGERAAPDARRGVRGYPPPAAAPSAEPGMKRRPAPPAPAQAPTHRVPPPPAPLADAPRRAPAPPANPPRPAPAPPAESFHRAPPPPPMAPRRAPAPPPTFESFGRGSEVRAQAERGHESRQSVPAAAGRANSGRERR
jgi:hypothetical protein